MHTHDGNTADPRLSQIAPRLIRVGAIVGVLGLGASATLGLNAHDGGKQFFHSYLLALTYFLSLSLGALFFVTLQHLTRAGWSVVVRRLAEIVASNLPLLVILFTPILISMLQGNALLYSWVDDALVQGDPLLHGKQPYLNVPFFVVRFAIYFAVWAVLSRYFLKTSVRQDQTGDRGLTAQMQKVSAPAMLLFALSLTFCAFDTLMSLEPHWFSTIFGVYFFAGSVVGFFCLMILMARGLQSSGIMRDVITVDHYHDLGKLLFGFVFFWGYIAFSQYMLIWYANIPEETEWYLERQTGEWVWVSLSLLFGHFLLPFPGLISRHAKRRLTILSFWAGFLLVMHWLDLYWLIMPSLQKEKLPFGVIDVACFLGVGGLYVANLGFTARDKVILAVKDPRLAESLAFENV